MKACPRRNCSIASDTRKNRLWYVDVFNNRNTRTITSEDMIHCLAIAHCIPASPDCAATVHLRSHIGRRVDGYLKPIPLLHCETDKVALSPTMLGGVRVSYSASIFDDIPYHCGTRA